MRMSRCIRSRSEGGARARGMAMVKRAKDTGGKTAGATNWFIDKVWLDAKDTGGKTAGATNWFIDKVWLDAKDTGGKTAGVTNWFIDKLWLDAKDTGGIDRRRYQLVY